MKDEASNLSCAISTARVLSKIIGFKPVLGRQVFEQYYHGSALEEWRNVNCQGSEKWLARLLAVARVKFRRL